MKKPAASKKPVASKMTLKRRAAQGTPQNDVGPGEQLEAAEGAVDQGLARKYPRKRPSKQTAQQADSPASKPMQTAQQANSNKKQQKVPKMQTAAKSS